MSPRPPKLSRRQKLIAMAPALLAIGATAVVASGASIVPGATAASTVTVTGSVTAGMSTAVNTANGACGASQSLAITGQFGDGAFHSTGGLCTVTFGTNSTAGATVSVVDRDGAAPFFCTGGTVNDNGTPAPNVTDDYTDCAGRTGNETVANNVGNTIANDEFGIALEAVTGAPLPTAGTGYAIPTDGSARNAGSESETIWGAVGPTAAVICETGGQTTTDQTCGFAFAVDGKGASQTAGAYAGTANVVATPK